MSNPAEQLDHHVAMSVTGLTTSVFDLTLLCSDQIAAQFASMDRDLIEAAHGQLGKLIERLPVKEPA